MFAPCVMVFAVEGKEKKRKGEGMVVECLRRAHVYSLFVG